MIKATTPRRIIKAGPGVYTVDAEEDEIRIEGAPEK